MYTETCTFACGWRSHGYQLLQRSHSADSTTDWKIQIPNLIPGVQALTRCCCTWMVIAGRLLVGQPHLELDPDTNCVYFCRPTGSVLEKDGGTSTRFWGKPHPPAVWAA